MLAGPSYSFKSFLLLDWLLCMASGRDWCGRPTAECKVGYALGEGKSSLMKRVQAWIAYNDLSREEFEKLQTNFRVTFEVPQLASKASTDNMLASLSSEGFKPDVLAVDTFARSMVGMDENDARDTGMWIESADRLRQLGYAVIFLHHTKKNNRDSEGRDMGAVFRGSTAIIGAMDTAMTLVRTFDNCKLTITKQKDHDEGKPMTFRKLKVGVGHDDSCVLIPAMVMDARYAAPPADVEPSAFEDPEVVIPELIEDATYKNDATRARELSKRCGISYVAAQSRISRANKELERPTNIILSGS